MIDFPDQLKDLVEEDVKLYILCNPHNPGGHVLESIRKDWSSLPKSMIVLLVSDRDSPRFGPLWPGTRVF